MLHPYRLSPLRALPCSCRTVFVHCLQPEKNFDTAPKDVDTKWWPVALWILTFLVVSAAQRVPRIAHFLATDAAKVYTVAAEGAFVKACYSCFHAMARLTAMEYALKL